MTTADFKLIQDIHKILLYGYPDEDPRPKYSDGTPAHTISVNHVVRTYNLQKEFPICTLRPIAWKTAIKEILWIYQDQSNSLELLNNKYSVRYWNDWESQDVPGTIGVRYGETVRRHNLVDTLLKDIKEDPYGRRHIISLWQEEDFKASDGLLPCAFLTNFNVRGEYLDMLLYQRSGDMLAASGAGGINEVQYAAFLMMIARATGYKPGKFTHVVCNEQIYDRHVEAARELLKRADALKMEDEYYTKYIFDYPVMKFEPKTDNFYDFTIDDFQLEGYEPKTPQLRLDLGI